MIAFRDFLYVFCGRLISDGHLYAKPQKTKNPADYPFLKNMNYLLIDIGNNGSLKDSSESLLISEIPSFSAIKPKIPASKQMEYLRFLALCGFVFTGIDLEAKTFHKVLNSIESPGSLQSSCAVIGGAFKYAKSKNFVQMNFALSDIKTKRAMEKKKNAVRENARAKNGLH